MDSNLIERLKSALDVLVQHQDCIDYRDPRTVIEYIEGNVTSLGKIWNNIEHNLDDLRGMSRKDVVACEFTYGQAIALFDKVTKGADEHDEMVQGLKEVLKLIDQAITNCPMEPSGSSQLLQLDTLFGLRAMTLLQCGMLGLALVAINRALALAPASPLYYAYKAQILIKLGRSPETYRLIKHYFHYFHTSEDSEPVSSSIPAALFVPLLNEFCFKVIGDPQGEDRKDPQQQYRENPQRFLEEVLHKLQADADRNIQVAAGYEDSEDTEGCDSSDDAGLETSYDSAKDDTELDFKEEWLADSAHEAEDTFMVPFQASDRNYSFDYRTVLRTTEAGGKGRYIAAEASIPKGACVFRERAYTMVLLEPALMHICSYCGRDVSNRFWPCAGCNQAVYCGEACAGLNQKLDHQYECGLTSYWKSKSTFHVFRMLNQVGIRTVLAAIQEQKGSPYDLTEYREDETQRSIEKVNKTRVQMMKEYQAQMTLRDHSDQYEPAYLSYNMGNAIECVIIACIVQGFEFNQLSREELIELIGHSFVAIRRVLTNAFRWSERDEETDEKVHVATCYQLMGALFNHSCEPNLEWYIDSGYLYMTTVRTVEAGEELTVSYGPNESEDFETRQKHLLKNYFFQCSCTACVDDARLVVALQCPACPGPVVPNFVDSSAQAKCLKCFEVYPNADEKFALLERTLHEHFTLIDTWNSDEDEQTFVLVAQIKEHLGQIAALIYHAGVHLAQSIYFACKIFYEADDLMECIRWGSVLDSALPLKGLLLITLPPPPPDDEPKLKESSESNGESEELLEVDDDEEEKQVHQSALYRNSAAFEPNIQHLNFWTDIYKAWIEQESPVDSQVWRELLRWYKRLHKLTKWAIAYKSGKLAAASQLDKVQLETDINELNKFKLRKLEELNTLKQKYGTEHNFSNIQV